MIDQGLHVPGNRGQDRVHHAARRLHPVLDAFEDVLADTDGIISRLPSRKARIGRADPLDQGHHFFAAHREQAPVGFCGGDTEDTPDLQTDLGRIGRQLLPVDFIDLGGALDAHIGQVLLEVVEETVLDPECGGGIDHVLRLADRAHHIAIFAGILEPERYDGVGVEVTVSRDVLKPFEGSARDSHVTGDSYELATVIAEHGIGPHAGNIQHQGADGLNAADRAVDAGDRVQDGGREARREGGAERSAGPIALSARPVYGPVHGGVERGIVSEKVNRHCR